MADLGSANALSENAKILMVCDSRAGGEQVLAGPLAAQDVTVVQDPLGALTLLTREHFDGVYVAAKYFQQAFELDKLLRNEQILEGMPDGVAMLESDNTIIWGNGRIRQWSGRDSVAGLNFYAALGSPEILGPDFCPFHTALATGRGTSSTLRSGENRYFKVHAAPVLERDSPPRHLIITVRDVTNEIQQQQKLAAIHQAGAELADLTPDEVFHMPVRERIELLKSNIIHFTKDLLRFGVVEIRMLDRQSNRLAPLLSVGMDPVAAARELLALPQGNGVTGFVAATGKSYLCEDTTEDPLYLEGVRGAKSSLTVPLLLHDEVIGTFNVESMEPRAFTDSDLQFLEIFGRDVAAALNTLELLVAEKASTAVESVEAIHSAVARPVDEILNEAVNVMERYIGHEPEVVERLQRILRNARDIKQVIQKVGQSMTPAQAHPVPTQIEERPILRGRRVLVVDADEAVRSAAHALLDRYGCIVETAHDGAEAACMVRGLREAPYEVVLADIRLPDMNGYELMLKLQELLDPVPLVLMTGFGYDPGHSIVNARKAGLPPWAVLYKPFRPDQLLGAVERIITEPGPVPQA
ncbi:MAG: response regulator [Thermoguttaceae bacterium]|jgi:CheY-like chemotaxis protein